MKYIVITQPTFFAGEAERIILMFQSGLQRLHLRKPDSTADEVRALLNGIPAVYHGRIVIHEHFELLHEFRLGGIHLNRRNPAAPDDWKGDVSISCHSLEELADRKKEPFAYLSLSPIFDSISKKGYCSAFTSEVLSRAQKQGIIDERVMALGGICRENVKDVLTYGFGGVMVLGDAWKATPLPVVMSVAGSDSSAGAGIQQDLKTMTNCGCYGTTCITAVTSQNTMGVQGVAPVYAGVVESQMCSVLSDMAVKAIKIGMIPNQSVAESIVRVVKEFRQRQILPVVYDPVMVSTSGTPLMQSDCIDYVIRELIPLCTLVTPNLPEQALLELKGCPTCNLLVKGGHAEGEEMKDVLYLADENRYEAYVSQRIETNNLHGTGCTLSSAIASYLAKGYALAEAVRYAKVYMDKAIEGGKELRLGHGNGPLWYTK